MTTEFYTLSYEPPARTTGSPMPYVISIEPFSAAPPYDSTRIIFTPGMFKISSYTYHEWMSLPADMATYLLARDIGCAGIVKAVMVGDDRLATHRMAGRVDSFLEEDGKDGWNAVLAISITLMKLNENDFTQQICLQKTYKVSEPCSEKNVTGLSGAMSAAMSKISAELVGDLQQTLKN